MKGEGLKVKGLRLKGKGSGMRFEELEVWKKSFNLTKEIFQIFKNCKDYSFKQQITKSALSIPSNIAEGFERNSNKELSCMLGSLIKARKTF